jgi:hypothetical protein
VARVKLSLDQILNTKYEQMDVLSTGTDYLHTEGVVYSSNTKGATKTTKIWVLAEDFPASISRQNS